MQINTLDELCKCKGKYVYIVMGDSIVSGIIDTYNPGAGTSYIKHPTLFIKINGATAHFYYPKITIAFTDLKEFLAYIEYHFGN